jgi:hypothetical protein
MITAVIITSVLILLHSNNGDVVEIMRHDEAKEIVKERLEKGGDPISISNDPPNGWETEIISDTRSNYSMLGDEEFVVRTIHQISFRCPSVSDISAIQFNPSKENRIGLSFTLNIHSKFNASQQEKFDDFAGKCVTEPLRGNFELFYEDDEISVVYFSFFVGDQLDPKFK